MKNPVNHHPDARVLNEFSSGALPLAQSVCISVHLHYCDQCKRQCEQLQQVGSELFDRLAPQQVDASVLDAVLSSLDEEPPLVFSKDVQAEDKPALVQRLMHGDYEDLEWKKVNSALQISRLRTGDPSHEIALYHIKAGRSIPKHTHRGTEFTLVLEGSFSDEEGVYQRGDFIERDADDVHTPTAAQSEDCICIGVLDAPVRFKPWAYRLLNPFLKLQAS
jgi:putative transcriptional regulator